MSTLAEFRAALADGRDEHVIVELAAGERAELDALCAQHRVRLVDTLDDQLLEWARTALPGEPKGEAAHQAAIEAERGPDAAAYGVWVFFPWLSLVTHLLPRERFRAVRTNRNRDKITHDEQQRLLTRSIGVVGLSVGHASALVIAQEGLCDELRIADFDHIELSNLNRLRTSLANLGVAKIDVTRREIAEIDPFIRVRCYPQGLTDDTLEDFLTGGGAIDLLVEECDTLPMKLTVREACRAEGIPVIMDTNDRGLLDVERFDLEPDRPVLHGLFGGVTGEEAASMAPADRMQLFYGFFGGEDRISPALQASLKRIGSELVSYPQLSSDVHLGAALVAHAARLVLLGRLEGSGRYRIDLDELLRVEKGTQV